MGALMIYGATGYTGRLAAEHAAAAGLDLILGGRNTTRLAAQADRLGVSHRAFGLDDVAAVAAALADVAVVLNCAGPFMRTAEPLMRAAIGSQTDYLDVAAELDSYRLADALDREARAGGVMLLPGSGGSVAMLGCLAGHAAGRVAEPARVRIACTSPDRCHGAQPSAPPKISPPTAYNDSTVNWCPATPTTDATSTSGADRHRALRQHFPTW